MKSHNLILVFVVIGFISCTNANDKRYINLVTEIHHLQKTTKYDYPVFDYLKDLDSISKHLINDSRKITPEEIKALEKFTSMRSLNDSTKKKIRNYLAFDIEKTTSKSIKERVKHVRLWYTLDVLNYLNKVEKDSSFNSLIVHRYSTVTGDSTFRNFDVYTPTGDGYATIVPLNPCKWRDLKHDGISILFNDYQRIDTVGFRIKWYDRKFRDTLKTVILQTK
jgi:hypothetical protein